MIQDFYVTNFSSIRDRQGISFLPVKDNSYLEHYTHEVKPGKRLLKFGIIYGTNASGKSTLLHAINFFSHLMLRKPKSKSDLLYFEPFMLDMRSRSTHSHMEISFYINELRYALDIEFDKVRIYKESLIVYMTNMPSTIYKREYNSSNDVTEVFFGNKSGLSKKAQAAIAGNTINNCSVIAAFSQTNVERSLLNDVYDFFNTGMTPLLEPMMDMFDFVKQQLRRQNDDGLKRFLLKMLQVSDFNIVDFNVKTREKEISPDMKAVINGLLLPEEQRNAILQKGKLVIEDFIFSHNGDGGIYQLIENAESNGTRRFLGLSTLLYKLVNENVFIPIDEIEASLHYELLQYFIRLFLVNSEGSSQLLVTTHDLKLLDEDFIRRDVVWFTDKDTLGATSVKRLSSLGLHNTISPYNAYRQGKLVNLPFLGSLFLDIKKEEERK